MSHEIRTKLESEIRAELTSKITEELKSSNDKELQMMRRKLQATQQTKSSKMASKQE